MNARTSFRSLCTWSARAVELPLDGCPAGALDGGGDVAGRLGEHRLDRTEHLETEAGEAGASLRECGLRHRRKLAREHQRTADVFCRDVGRPRDRVDHDSLERPLPELAVERPAEKPLLGLRRPAEQSMQLVPALRLRAGAGGCSDTPEGRVDVENLERGVRRGGGGGLEAPPNRRRCGEASRRGT